MTARLERLLKRVREIWESYCLGEWTGAELQEMEDILRRYDSDRRRAGDA